MKALSIEEIKQLNIGDWIWVVSIYYGSEYRQIVSNSCYEDCENRLELAPILYIGTPKKLRFQHLFFSDYKKTWVAYKNKEQAECKGEQIDLICKVGDTIYMPWVYSGVSDIAKCVVEMVQISDFGISYCTDLSDDCDAEDYLRKYNYGVFETSNFNINWFLDEKLAEQKLKELRGEV